MKRIPPLKYDEVAAELKKSLSITETSITELPDFFRILANSPIALKAYVLADMALQQGELTHNERVLIALLVAEIHRCPSNLCAQYTIAKNVGLSEEEIEMARKATSNDPVVKALLRFTVLVTLQQGNINEEDFESMKRAGFSNSKIIEIIAIVCLNMFVNYLNTVTKTEVNFSHSNTQSSVGI